MCQLERDLYIRENLTETTKKRNTSLSQGRRRLKIFGTISAIDHLPVSTSSPLSMMKKSLKKSVYIKINKQLGRQSLSTFRLRSVAGSRCCCDMCIYI